MQQSAVQAESALPPSFAGMLVELADPEKKFPPVRDLDGLEDDVATLSYESALRATKFAVGEAVPSTSGPRPVPVAPAQPATRFESPSPAAGFSAALAKPGDESSSLSALEANRKSASVTIRLSPPEAEQLRVRAAEAGITVSAYLRSCAFEVESLRAQVKATLAEMKAAKETQFEEMPKYAAQPKDTSPRVWQRWLSKVVPPKRAAVRA